MPQLDYGDFYKFVASAGIALIAGAVAVPWLFLREPFDLTIESSKLQTLTPLAQSVVTHRQALIAGMLPLIPWVSAGLAALGLALVVLGLLLWYSRQRIRDRGEEAATKKAERELEQIPRREVEANARQDLEPIEEELQLTPSVEPASTSVKAYLDAERALFAKMTECLPLSTEMLTHQRSDGVEYDAILRLKPNERVIVEVKYIRKGFNRGWLSESVNELTAKTALFANKFSTSSRAILVIILASPNRIFVEKIEKFTEEMNVDRPRSVSIRVHCFAASDIPGLTCQQVRQMFEM
jgi:hypothetical protein